MNISRTALAALVLSSGFAMTPAANACSVTVYGNGNQVSCNNVDAKALARELILQAREEQRQPRNILVCVNGPFHRIIENPAVEINPWNNQCIVQPGGLNGLAVWFQM